MNLIEALRQANGKPVCRPGFSTEGIVSVGCGGVMVWKIPSPLQGIVEWHPTQEALLADDWYVVEPKSRIEEAIDVSIKTLIAHFANDLNKWCVVDNQNVSIVTGITREFNRIVNLTLDEAKDVVKSYGYSDSGNMQKEIDALKVKL